LIGREEREEKGATLEHRGHVIDNGWSRVGGSGGMDSFCRHSWQKVWKQERRRGCLVLVLNFSEQMVHEISTLAPYIAQCFPKAYLELVYKLHKYYIKRPY
jgi:hypothetical protein